MRNILEMVRPRILSFSFVTGLVLSLASSGAANMMHSAATDSSGNIYTASGYPSNAKIRVSKRDASNTTAWVKDFNLPSPWTLVLKLPCVTCDGSGNTYVAALIGRTGPNRQKIEIFKVSSTGTTVTTKLYDPVSSGGDIYLGGIVVDGTGNIYINGAYSPGGASTAYTPFVNKYNSTLSTVSTNVMSFSGVGDYLVSDIAKDSSGNIYCAESGYNTTTLASFTAVFKYNSSFGLVSGWPAVDSYPPNQQLLGNAGNLHLNSAGTLVTYVTNGVDTLAGTTHIVAVQHSTSTAVTNWMASPTVNVSGLVASLVDSSGDVVAVGPTATGYAIVKLSGSTGATTWTTPVSSGLNNVPAGICQDLSGDYLTVYPYQPPASSNHYSAVDPISSGGTLGTQLLFGSSSANLDYGYAIFATSTSGTFVVSAVGYNTSAYYPLVYRQGSSPWYSYQTATTP